MTQNSWNIDGFSYVGDESDLRNRNIEVTLSHIDGRSMSVTFSSTITVNVFNRGSVVPDTTDFLDSSDSVFHDYLSKTGSDSDDIYREVTINFDSSLFTAYSADGVYSYSQITPDSDVPNGYAFFPITGDVLDSDGNIFEHIEDEITKSMRNIAFNQVSYVNIWGDATFTDLVENGEKYEI